MQDGSTSTSSDRIVPVPYWEDTLLSRKTVLSCMFRFDNVLDPEILKEALTKLLTLPGWSVLGARIRQKRGRLEYHIPAIYSQQRPAFLWAVDQYDVKSVNHEYGKHLPTASGVPTVVVNSKLLEPLIYVPGFPTKLKEFLKQDVPQLAIHIVSFTDTTTVSITCPHTLTDGMGFGELMSAWCLVIQGREDEVRQLHDPEKDVLGNFGLGASQPYLERKRILSIFQLSLFGIRLAYQTVRRRGDEKKVICMPGATLQRLHHEAKQDLMTRYSMEKPPFISEGDVLLAWWAKVTARQYRKTSKRTFSLVQVLGYRSFCEKELTPSQYSYIGNVTCLVSAYYKTHEIYDLPLSEIALKIRQALADLQSREQIEALAGLYRKWKDTYGLELVSGDLSMNLVSLSNWTKAKLFELDFSAAAIVHEKTNEIVETQERQKKPLYPSYVHPCSTFDYWLPLRNQAFLPGKDEHGNYWFNASLQKDVWSALELGVAEYAGSSTNISIYQDLTATKK